MTGFMDEKDFDEFFFSLNDPTREVQELAKWRQFQMRVVSKFIKQIRLIANDQYTNLDHFLLELLQNADDNTYPDDAEKTFKLTLTQDSVIIENNEIGFSAENLYAITYSGASTKTRTKTSRTYIGEKGIGFKSVFAVADHVDIHSPPYHFRLRNDEYIVPHPLPEAACNGTRIVIRLKPSGQGIREILADRIESLACGAQEFTLFLQQLERLELADERRGTKSTVVSARDDAKGYYVIDHDGNTSEYIKLGYERTIPLEIAKTRFDEVDTTISREVTFAVPMPPGDGSEPEDNGMLFCFLPTGVRTGVPIHIQADAKTITNRENIQPFASSDWNRVLFEGFANDMRKLYMDLREYRELRAFFPAYWPTAIKEKNLGNRDLELLLDQVEQSLGGYPVFLDRHGEFRYRHKVRMVPSGLGPYLREVKYEDAVTHHWTRHPVASEWGEDDAQRWAEELGDKRITFISPVWELKYSENLERLDVGYLNDRELHVAFTRGAPSALDVHDDEAVRAFLSAIIDHAETHRAFDPSLLPIFPVFENGRRGLAGLDETTMWLQTDSSRVPSNTAARVIDPAFTYSPGGGQQKEGGGDEVRVFNQRFRRFLAEHLGVSSYSEEEFLQRSLIPKLTNLELDVSKKDQRDDVIGLWQQLFAKIWRRRKTIIKDSGEEKLKEIFDALALCKIPTRAAGTREWFLTPVNLAFLGRRFRIQEDLEQAYAGTGAPIIDLGTMEPRTKRKKNKKPAREDWEQWRDFLMACDANDGPYRVRPELTSLFGWHLEIDPVGGVETRGLLWHLREGLSSNLELMRSGATTVQIKGGSVTTSLDDFTLKLLGEGRRIPGGLPRLAELYKTAREEQSVLFFVWGNLYRNRQIVVNYVAALDELAKGITVPSSIGDVNSRLCFLKSAEAERILGDIAAIVDAAGVDPSFLAHIGVRERVTVEALTGLIDTWFQESQGRDRSLDGFAPYVEAVRTYAQLYPQDVHWLALKAKLFDPQTDSLIGVEEWLDKAASFGFSDEVVTWLGQALHCDQERTPRQILDALFSLDDLTRDPGVTLRLLAELGKNVANGEEGIADVFARELSVRGLMVGGQRIHSVEELPPVWDRWPSPLNDREFLVLHSSGRQRKDFRAALSGVGWIYLGEEVAMHVDVPDESQVDEVTARRIHLAVSELREDLRECRPAIAKRIDSFQLFGDSDEVRRGIVLADSLFVEAGLDGQTFRCEVPYWFGGGRLVIPRRRDLVNELPRFLDDHAGTTFAGIFHYLWKAKEQESRVFVPSSEHEPTVNPPEYRGSGHKGPGGVTGEPVGRKSDHAGSIFDDLEGGEGEHEATKEGDGGKRNSTLNGNNPPQRKRLQTVVLAMLGASSTSPTEPGEGEDTHNKEVEDAGRKRFLAYLRGQGAEVVSREADNIGYDFEVSVGDESFYVELKSSQDQWRGWEHALSTNEFKTALELGDKYFLCAVDYVFNDDKYQLYFIRDPANNVASFAFDSPWKALAMPMKAYLSRLKDKQGLLE